MRWTTEGIRRVRRRTTRGVDPTVAPVDAGPGERADVEVTVPRSRLEEFVTELAGAYRLPVGPPSPAILTAVFSSAIDRAGGLGRPSVTRSPAGVTTPESWRFRIEAADGPAQALLERAGREGRDR